jgi:hypothetical protein
MCDWNQHDPEAYSCSPGSKGIHERSGLAGLVRRNATRLREDKPADGRNCHPPLSTVRAQEHNGRIDIKLNPAVRQALSVVISQTVLLASHGQRPVVIDTQLFDCGQIFFCEL